MRMLPLSERSSLRLDRQVMSYQSQPENAALYRILHEKTQQLLYELPAYLHLLDEEECASFLFFCYDAIDHYITSFRIGRLSYLGYLSQVVRQRSRYYIAQQKERTKREVLLIRSQEYPVEQESALLTAEPTLPYGPAAVPRQGDPKDLPSLFKELLAASAQREYEPEEAGHEILRARFQNPTNRRRLLIVLTLCADVAHHHLLQELSTLLRVEQSRLSSYLATVEALLYEKRLCQQHFEAVCNRHFRRLLELEAELEAEVDPDKRALLEQKRERTSQLYKAKVTKIRNREIALTHSEASRLLGIPKGTIDSSVHYIRKLLQSYMDEMDHNGYS